jgi:hypothetical protein
METLANHQVAKARSGNPKLRLERPICCLALQHIPSPIRPRLWRLVFGENWRNSRKTFLEKFGSHRSVAFCSAPLRNFEKKIIYFLEHPLNLKSGSPSL